MKRLILSLRKIYGRYRGFIKLYQVPPQQTLNSILKLFHIQWHFITLLQNLAFFQIRGGFHTASVTVVACQEEALTPLNI